MPRMYTSAYFKSIRRWTGKGVCSMSGANQRTHVEHQHTPQFSHFRIECEMHKRWLLVGRWAWFWGETSRDLLIPPFGMPQWLSWIAFARFTWASLGDLPSRESTLQVLHCWGGGVWMKVKVSVSPFFFSLIVKCNCTCYSLKDNHRLYCFCFVFFFNFVFPFT